jgi:hypothetical protein
VSNIILTTLLYSLSDSDLKHVSVSNKTSTRINFNYLRLKSDYNFIVEWINVVLDTVSKEEKGLSIWAEDCG